MALQIQAEQTDCLITAVGPETTRDLGGTPEDPTDDTFSIDLTVLSEGVVGAGWVVTGPAGSSLLGQTGGYNVPVNLAGLNLSNQINALSTSG